MDIVLFGMQGSGKWTQAKKILSAVPDQFVYFEPGSLFRALSSCNNVLGEYVGSVIDQWKPVHDGVTISLFDATLYTLQRGQHLLIDGFPRKVMQYHLFMERMQKGQRDFLVINFNIDEKTATERMLARGRHDDTPEKIANRIQWYNKDILPILESMRTLVQVHDIDATQTPDEVTAQILPLLSA